MLCRLASVTSGHIAGNSVARILREDHLLLRQELRFVEEMLMSQAVNMAELERSCSALIELFMQHIGYEDRFTKPYRTVLYPWHRHLMLHPYADQLSVLNDMRILLFDGFFMSARDRAWHLSRMLAELGEHMDEEERVILPALERGYPENPN